MSTAQATGYRSPERSGRGLDEIAALQMAVDLHTTVIDTAATTTRKKPLEMI